MRRRHATHARTAATAAAVAGPMVVLPDQLDGDAVYVPPPSRDVERTRVYDRPASGARRVRGINNLDCEAQNRSLGATARSTHCDWSTHGFGRPGHVSLRAASSLRRAREAMPSASRSSR